MPRESLTGVIKGSGMATNLHVAKLAELTALELQDLWGTVGDELAQQGLIEKAIPDWPSAQGKASGLQKGKMKRLANQTAWSETGVVTTEALYKGKDEAFWEVPGLALVEAISAGLVAAGAKRAPRSVKIDPSSSNHSCIWPG